MLGIAGGLFPADSLSYNSADGVHLVPAIDGCCDRCQCTWSTEDPKQAGWTSNDKATLYALSGCIAAAVYYRKCSNRRACIAQCESSICSSLWWYPQAEHWLMIVCMRRSCPGRQQYDGYEDGIFNYSNTSLFTYELCFNYADGMVASRLPFATHWQLLRRNYKRADMQDQLCSRITHR